MSNALCQFGGDLFCVQCGYRAKVAGTLRVCGPVGGVAMRDATLAATQASEPAGGPGTELKAILRDWLGIAPSEDCACNSMAGRMDALGPEWCEGEGMAEILGVMRAEHAKRREAGETKLPWTDFGATQLVRLACRRARAKASA